MLQLLPVESIEWERRLNKIQQKAPACIDSLGSNHHKHHSKRKQVDVVSIFSYFLYLSRELFILSIVRLDAGFVKSYYISFICLVEMLLQ